MSFFDDCGKLQIHFPLKVYSISSNFAWSFLNIKYFTNKVEKELYVFKQIFWKLCTQSCLISLRNTTGSYTLQSWAYGFSDSSKFLERFQNCYLVVENWENSEILTPFLKTWRTSWYFLSQIAFWIPYCINVQINGVSIPQTFRGFNRNLDLFNKNRAFLSFVGFWGVFEANSKNIAVISSQMPTEYRD